MIDVILLKRHVEGQMVKHFGINGKRPTLNGSKVTAEMTIVRYIGERSWSRSQVQNL